MNHLFAKSLSAVHPVVCIVFLCLYHSVARQCVHCCNGYAASLWQMAILGC